MALTGQLSGRDPEIGALRAALRDCKGAYLVGSAGVGKSHLVEHVASWAAGEGWEVIRARATSGSSELPLGVFLTQLGAAERFLTPMFSEIRDRIVERAAGRRILLCVDDIDRLDDTSAVLIHQMVASNEASLVATLRMGRMAPGEILDLAQRGDLRRVEVGPMGRESAAEMAQHVLGRQLDAASHERLWNATNGNPLFVREVLLSAQESGQLTEGPDGVSLAELPLNSARLADAVKGRLAFLTPELHRALLHLAFAEPCGPAELASVADADALAALEAAELIETGLDDRRLSLRLIHPLYGEVLRAGTPLLQRRAVLATLARDLQDTGTRRRIDIVKLARLAVDGGFDVDLDLLVRAAQLTYHNNDHVLCERIGRKAFEMSGRFDAGWELANCLFQAGDLRGFRDHLPAWRATATNDAEHLATSMMEAQTEFWYAGDLRRAEEIIERALVEHPHDVFAAGASRDELVANLALYYALAGNPRRAWELSEPLLAHGPDPVLIRGALAAANALGHMGLVEDATAVIDRAIEAYGILGPEASSLSQRVAFAVRAVGQAWRGRMDLAWADSASSLATAISEFQISSANYVTADLHMLEGRPAMARPLMERSLAWFGRSTGGSSERRWVLARMVSVCATGGDVVAAQRALELFDTDVSPGVSFDFDADIGRARLLIATGHSQDARDGLRAAMKVWAHRGQRVGEILVAYELVRADRSEEVAARIEQLAAESQGSLFAALAHHAVARAANDGDALAAAAEELAALALNLYASEAAGHAADALRRRGDQRAATRMMTRAAELRQLCDEGITAEPIIDSGPTTLTRREREIGLLAAQGLASKEIGERLFISRRTAENHLAKVYDKLGVRTRAELTRVLDGGYAAVA
jgi:DNA-binding CsgD family transcriptional regulator